MLSDRRIRVLIVDDSAMVRKVLADALAEEPDLEVVGSAPDPYVARDKILALRPDVLTLDVEMPRMDGLTFLRKLMHFHPMATVVVSSLAKPSCSAAIEALESGAVEVLSKPGGPDGVEQLRRLLPNKIRAAAMARIRKVRSGEAQAENAARHSVGRRDAPGAPVPSIIAIGASTGGTEAIAAVLTQFPESSPGILIVQHIPAGFSAAFARRMNEVCAIEVREAQDGDELRPGMALIAPGDYHMLLRCGVSRKTVSVKTGPRVLYQRPSVDVLFTSVAEAVGPSATGILLTGMGSDGAQGLLRMREAGAHTIAQDEASCVVFGMPREAIQLGAAAEVLPLSAIAGAVLSKSGPR
jgi:two-component system chemotaxis response regulator CheB